VATGWIVFDKALPSKPEVSIISRTLGISRAEAVLACMMVWAWVDENTTDGVMDGLSIEDVDYQARITGFGAAMVSAGWLQADDRGLIFPNFDRWNTETAKQRLQKSQRQRRWRSKGGAASTGPSTGASTPASTEATTTEQKRREEERRYQEEE
jgi:hypothetical protein